MSIAPARELADAIRAIGMRDLLVVTGAGISLASGIPTFRGSDPGAVWKRDITELGTFRYFREDPVGSWEWYLERFNAVLGKKPNPAHHAVAALERWHRARGGSFLLVTQNIDTLHDEAGSEHMVKVHGTADRVRCPRQGCRLGSPSGSLPRSEIAEETAAFLAEPSLDTVPRCPECGDILRQHVLWFDEYYGEHSDYQWERVQQSATRMHLALFIGTSFAVGVTELFLQNVLFNKIPAFSVDPSGAKPQYPGVEVLAEKAEELLPAVCAELGATLPMDPS